MKKKRIGFGQFRASVLVGQKILAFDTTKTTLSILPPHFIKHPISMILFQYLTT